MTSSIDDKRKARAAFMNALYDASNGSELFYDTWGNIGAQVGLSDEEAHAVARFLRGEGLLEFATIGTVSITHWGVKEVEASRLAPDAPTEHFAAYNVIIGDVYNSQVQQGTDRSSQSAEFGSDQIDAVRELIRLVRGSVEDLEPGEDARRQAEAELMTLEAQMAAPKPNHRILRASLETLNQVAISVGGSMGAQAIMHQFSLLGVA